MNSDRNPLIPSDDYLPRHYQLLLQRINLAAKEANDMALLVFDGQDAGRDKKLSRAVASFLFKSPFGRTMENLTETPLFVDSYITVGIQLADLVAGLLRLGQDNGLKPGRLFSSPYLSSVNRMHTAIRGKSRDLAEPDPQNPLTIYGIYATTAGYLFRDPPRDRDSDAVAG